MRILTLAALVALSSSAALAQQAGDAKNGETHFISDGCYQCHGYAGQGALVTGPRIARTALTFEQFLNQLRKPANAMAPYEAPIMPDTTARDIYAYLKALPAPPDPKDLPILFLGRN